MTAYTLFGAPQTGSMAVEAALVEAGAEFHLVNIDTKNNEHMEPAYMAVNPRQQVPALRLPDGTIVTESPAMLLHIADAFPHAQLAPPPGSSARALHDRWLIFFAVNIYEGELRKGYSDRYTVDPTQAVAVATAADRYIRRHYQIFEEQLRNQPFFFGQTRTVLDIYLWMLVQWTDQLFLDEHCPKILALAEAVKTRPLIKLVQLAHFNS